ncbi:MAG TPA: ABC transporter substrate-binding protein, partial [Candidatus Polarisedimenticolia bacterium]|nr:ABC transporter substrate-binding protein [Candidatus Polarisedimenticolia bacterium]
MMVRAVRAAFLAAAAVLVCCSPAQEKTTGGDSYEAPASGDWLVFGDTTEPSTLDCLRVNERAGRQICRLVADSLIDFDAHFRFVPRLAESFDVSPDGLAVTFRLRDGVQWHDGRPFTARDVLDTVDRIRHLDPDGQRYRDLFGPMDSVTLADDRTIRANYSEPFAGALVGWRETFIVPSQAGSATPRAPGAPAPENAPVGTGPFRFVSWEPQRQIILEANGGYFGGRPRIDRYIHRVVPNSEALRQALETGAVDVAGLTSSWMAGGRAQGDDGLPFRVHVFPTTYMQMVFWNIDAPGRLFADARVRTALTMLLDREGYAERVHHGIYRPATTLIDPAIWGGDPALEPLPYDPAAAASLLDEAGVIDRDGDGVRETASWPMSFTLIYTPMTPGNAEIAG